MTEESDTELLEMNSPKTPTVTINDNDSLAVVEEISTVPPVRPTSTANSVTGKASELGAEVNSQLESPIVAGPNGIEDEEEEEDDNAGYGESAERDEIIRERINRTQEQMR